jgi:nanoRNase/pAp phosphatase (c-di-AMP/oligoRNAs hydrolase)
MEQYADEMLTGFMLENINILTADAWSIHHQGDSTSYRTFWYSHNYVPKSSPKPFSTIFTQIFLSLTSQ